MQRLRGGNKVASQRDKKEDAEHRVDGNKRLRGVGSSWATRGLKAMVQSLNFILVALGIAQKKKKSELEALASSPPWWHHTKSQHGSICIFP